MNIRKGSGRLLAGTGALLFTAALLLAQDAGQTPPGAPTGTPGSTNAPAPQAAEPDGGAAGTPSTTPPTTPMQTPPGSSGGNGPTTPPSSTSTSSTTSTTPAVPHKAEPPNIAALPAGAQVRGDRKIIMNFQNASMDTVLAYLSELGGLTILNDHKIESRVNVMNKQPMTVDEAVEVLNTILKAKGYAGVRTGRTLRIVPLDAAKKATIPVRTGNDHTTIAETDEIITQVIPVRFADATQLKRDLSPLIPSYADLSSNTSTNTLIMTDTSANVRRLVQIISAMDTTVSTVSQVKVYNLKYANATAAAKLVTDVFKQETGGTTSAQQQRGGFGRFFGGGGAQPASPDESGTKPQAKVLASADDRTNTLVVSAPPDLMPMIDEVLAKLDENPAQDQAVFTFRLKNAQAVSVANSINGIFNPGSVTTAQNSSTAGNAAQRNITGGAGNASTTGRAAGSTIGGRNTSTTGTAATTNRNTTAARVNTPRIATGGNQTAAEIAGQVYVIADTDTNSVLVMTGSTNYERVKELIEELDRPVKQVLIKVLMAEVTHGSNVDLGVELSALNIKGTQIFTDFGLSTVTTGGLIAKTVQADFAATVVALEKIGKLEVLSRPYILASDNQTASITVGQTVPFIVSSQTTLDTGQTINNIEYQDIGIILNVTPRINPDGMVTLDVSPEISSISEDQTIPISDTLNATVFNKRSASTRVAIADGQTIVIGGLMQNARKVTRSQVPLLGDIPILGMLFARDETDKQKTELLIFLTPHVADNQERLTNISDQEKAGVEMLHDAVEKDAYEKQLDGMDRGGVNHVDKFPRKVPAPPAPAPAKEPRTKAEELNFEPQM